MAQHGSGLRYKVKRDFSKESPMRIIVPLCAILLTACATSNTGADFDAVAARKVTRGMTREEVQGLVGQPINVSLNADGLETWTWSYMTSSAIAIPLPLYTHMDMNLRQKTLIVQFREGKVTEMTLSIPTESAPTPAQFPTDTAPPTPSDYGKRGRP